MHVVMPPLLTKITSPPTKQSNQEIQTNEIKMMQKRKLPHSTTRHHVTFDVEHNDVQLITSLKDYKTGLWLSNYERAKILRRAQSLALEMDSILHPAVIEWIYKDSIRGLEYMAATTKHMANESRVATKIWELNYSDDDDDCNNKNKMMEKKVETKKKLTREESLNKKALFAYLKRSRRAAEGARKRAKSDKKFVDNNIIRYNTNKDRKELPHPPRPTPFIFCKM